MDKTHIPLVKWFWAIFLVGTDKRGHSALSLSRELEISYKSAWYLLQRIRTAMTEVEQSTMLSGFVELDDSFFGAADNGGKRGRGTDKTKVIIGLSLTDDGSPKHVLMKIADDVKSSTISDFVESKIVEGSTVSTDEYRSYRILDRIGYDHQSQASTSETGKPHLKWLHTIVSNAKAFINGTYHGLDKKHLQLYLDEFCFRFNWRFDISKLFNRLLFSCLIVPKVPFAVLTE